jgi:hypothetical protein
MDLHGNNKQGDVTSLLTYQQKRRDLINPGCVSVQKNTLKAVIHNSSFALCHCEERQRRGNLLAGD